jgi:RND family efflux transporter MFP subunit
MSDLKAQLESLRLEEGPPRRAGKWLLLLAVLLGLGALGYWKLRLQSDVLEVQTVQASVIAADDPAAKTPLLSAAGYVVARRKAVVSAKIQGRLAQLKVEEGSQVHEGDVIARLESTDYEAAVQQARASVQRAEADLAEFRRQANIAERLAQQDVGSRDAAEAAASRVRLADAQLAQARSQLDYNDAQLRNTYITAPFSGVVVKKMAEVGESVAPIPPGVNISTASGAIVALADFASLEAEVDVAEANVARLGASQPAEVTVEAIPDKTFRGVLRQVIPTADRTKATVQVKVTIVEKDRNLKPEMSCKVTFLERQKPQTAAQRKTERQVTVPSEALTTRNGKAVVFEIVAGKAMERPVETAGEYRGRAAVRSGLAGAETLVANPPEKLKSGDAVKVKG